VIWDCALIKEAKSSKKNQAQRGPKTTPSAKKFMTKLRGPPGGKGVEAAR